MRRPATSAAMGKVLLVSMPYGALDRPALGISLLKAELAQAGVACDVRYLAHTFAEFVGKDDYIHVGEELPYVAFAGEWTFAEALYGPRPDVDCRVDRSVFRQRWGFSEDSIARVKRVRSYVPLFLAHCLQSVPWGSYDIVGFTSTFEQNLASLAMARLVKDRHPHITTVMGGANWEGAMGLELHRQFPSVDVVCSGEADESFSAFTRYRLTRRPRRNAATDIPGLVLRRGTESVSTGPAPLVSDMDALPVPDFTDYFDGLDQSALGCDVVPKLLMETSRGCWWGVKSHCTFCGLNGGTIAFRSKSSDRALEEIRFLTSRWSNDFIEIVDNILDMRYFNDFLPSLAEDPAPYKLFYEIKANLNKEQVALLSAAGVHRVQPGIESMSDGVLQLMRKGTSALQNIQLLRWCKQYGVGVDWNLLYGFPGETREQYDEMLSRFPAIRFLQAPGASGPVRLDRFSPYFNQPEAFGILNVRPMAPYEHLYPFDRDSLMNIAYFFDYDYAKEEDPDECWRDAVTLADEWRLDPETGTLASVTMPDGSLEIVDTREHTAGGRVRLDPTQRTIYEFCDQVRSLSAIEAHAATLAPDLEVTHTEVEPFLQSLVDRLFMVRDRKRFLALAIPVESADNAIATDYTTASVEGVHVG